MTAPALGDEAAGWLASLEAVLAGGPLPESSRLAPEALDASLRALVRRHGAAAGPLLQRLVEQSSDKTLRKAARRGLYRLEQSGFRRPGPVAVRPIVAREAEQPLRAWLSGIDGSGSRALWLLFGGGIGGGLRLCSLILNDEVGILEAAGGPISRKRLDAELRRLREHQKLPWVEVDAGPACDLVLEALALHGHAGTAPPPEFARWRRLFGQRPDPQIRSARLPAAAPPAGPRAAPIADEVLVERSAELLALPELLGWFLDPEKIQESALGLLQIRESRLVLPDQAKAEREAAIVDEVIDAHLSPETRRRWADRLGAMASLFRATGREGPATLAESTAAALADLARAARVIPFVRALAARGLEMAAEVALGRAKLSDVSRAPVRRARP